MYIEITLRVPTFLSDYVSTQLNSILTFYSLDSEFLRFIERSPLVPRFVQKNYKFRYTNRWCYITVYIKNNDFRRQEKDKYEKNGRLHRRETFTERKKQKDLVKKKDLCLFRQGVKEGWGVGSGKISSLDTI